MYGFLTLQSRAMSTPAPGCILVVGEYDLDIYLEYWEEGLAGDVMQR